MKKKFISSFFALFLAFVLSFSGVGGSYIQARASSGVFDVLWNTDATVMENIGRHMLLWANVAGVAVSPNLITGGALLINASDFYNFMISDGYSEEDAEDVAHGGGGFVRDGISRDDDGNVTYSDEVSDLFYKYLQYVIVKECGFAYVQTWTTQNIPPSWKWFTQKSYYDNMVSTIKKNVDDNSMVYLDFYTYYSYGTEDEHDRYKILFVDADVPLYSQSADDGLPIHAQKINDDWTLSNFDSYYYQRDDVYTSSEYKTNEIEIFKKSETISFYDTLIHSSNTSTDCFFIGLFSDDGRYVRVWYDLDKYKEHVVGYEPYYVTDSFNNYDVTNDNSVTMTNTDYQYYQDNSTKIYYQIQDKIVNDDGNDLTENDIRDIINDTFDDLKNKDNGGGSGSDSDGSGGSDDSGGGTGVLDVVNGIGKIFDTILSLIGKVMGVVADFTNSVLDLFDGFTVFTDGFSEFLTGSFGFIPTEVWNMVTAGLGLMVLLAVIKFLRK